MNGRILFKNFINPEIGENTQAEIPAGTISIEQLAEGCKAKDPIAW